MKGEAMRFRRKRRFTRRPTRRRFKSRRRGAGPMRIGTRM